MESLSLGVDFSSLMLKKTINILNKFLRFLPKERDEKLIFDVRSEPG